jgi:hypothetical protein
VLITLDCVDPDFNQPTIDADEQRTLTDPATGDSVSYRYLHGVLSGGKARFALYFPMADAYQGRFFESTYPTVGNEQASPDTVAFGITQGAYVVSTDNGGGVQKVGFIGGYRPNAAAAKFSRRVAAALYGEGVPVRGYLYGASGGAYQTIGGAEHTVGVWDGFAPMVPGTANSIPSNQAAMLLGLRVLDGQLPAIVDAVAPGGSGEPYATLNDEQQAVLNEITSLGFPVSGWWQYADLNGGSFYDVASGVRQVDGSYVDDFWSVPGYEGADPASPVQAARIRFDTTVTKVEGGSVTLRKVPAGDLRGTDLVVTSGAAAGSSAPFVNVDGHVVSFAHGRPGGELKVGDHVRLDNSWVLALQYYPRYQVPASTELTAWNQYRDGNGDPLYPQRPSLVGALFSRASGGTPTGVFQGKMIMLASTMDVEAFAWSADWYRRQATADQGAALDDSYRLWYMENADHTPPKSIVANDHIVSYGGELEQALLYLDAWVLDGTPPPATTAYTISDDLQVTLTGDAATRGGVQPVTALAVSTSCASAGDQVTIQTIAGTEVAFTVTAAAPTGTGKIVRVEWDFDGSGTYAEQSTVDQPTESVELCTTHTFAAPGTYFAVVRVTSERDGDATAVNGRVQNLARVRIVVW